jgi:hypothetical protein
MKVFIYRNIQKEGNVFSIKVLEGPLKNRVVGHANGLFLKDCQFAVSQAGRQRVLREKRKNVHAGVVGDLVAVTGYRTRIHNTGLDFDYMNEEAWQAKYAPGVPVTYNPYLYSSFVLKGTTSAIHKAENVMIIGSRVEAYFKQKGEKPTYLK